MFRNVFSFETERRKDLDTLAETEALCQHRLEAGTCKKEQCANCEYGCAYSNCISQLPDCDKLYVHNRALSITGERFRRFSSWDVIEHRDHLQRLESRSDIKSAITCLVAWLGGAAAFFIVLNAILIATSGYGLFP